MALTDIEESLVRASTLVPRFIILSNRDLPGRASPSSREFGRCLRARVVSNSELYLLRGSTGRAARPFGEMLRELPIAESPAAASPEVPTSEDVESGANRDIPAVPAFPRSPEVDRGKGTRGAAGAEGDVSIWLLSPVCLRLGSSVPLSLGTYDARGEGLEVLLFGTRDGLLAPVGGEGVLDSRLDDGLGCPSLSRFKEVCLGTGKSAGVVETVSTLCRWPCTGRRIGKPALAFGGGVDVKSIPEAGLTESAGSSNETRGRSNDVRLRGDTAGAAAAAAGREAEVGFNKDQSGMSMKGRPLLVPISSTSSTLERSGDNKSLDLRSRRTRVGLTSSCAAANLAAEASRS